mmetsp:Transcript_73475/g.192701  ORF Transcript_73475/g.192701 Transcript_73475/m.192701 type:complete len:145 (-) Transcript_73475:120-554(-)
MEAPPPPLDCSREGLDVAEGTFSRSQSPEVLSCSSNGSQCGSLSPPGGPSKRRASLQVHFNLDMNTEYETPYASKEEAWGVHDASDGTTREAAAECAGAHLDIDWRLCVEHSIKQAHPDLDEDGEKDSVLDEDEEEYCDSDPGR